MSHRYVVAFSIFFSRMAQPLSMTNFCYFFRVAFLHASKNVKSQIDLIFFTLFCSGTNKDGCCCCCCNWGQSQLLCSMTVHVAKVGGAVTLWLVRSSPDLAVRVRALAGDIVLCSWARHLTLTVPLSTQVYKWVPANLMLAGNPATDWHPIQGGVEILLVASCH